MVSESTDLIRVSFLVFSWLLLFAGATLDLGFIGLYQMRRLKPSLRARADIADVPFSAFSVLLVLFTTLMFVVPAFFQPASPATPKASALLAGPVFYLTAGFVTVVLCLSYARTSARAAFFPARCGIGEAVRKGFLLGFAILPPVVLLSSLASAAVERLGYKAELQEVFDWLSDPSLPPATRAFMIVAAVVLAPIVEETLFRGILLPALMKGRSFFFAALISATYFALVHLHAPSFLPLLALGLAFSAGYAATGSILTPIIMHALFNFTSLCFYFAES